MTIYQLLLILLTVLALSAGQVLFKLAANEMHFSFSNLLTNILNVKLLIALFVYAIDTVLWLIVLKLIPLRIAYPFAGLAIIFVLIFYENISW
jgi:undecaprenyl phosphate-alpha-L-ara4N flippase subunit ArnE